MFNKKTKTEPPRYFVTPNPEPRAPASINSPAMASTSNGPQMESFDSLFGHVAPGAPSQPAPQTAQAPQSAQPLGMSGFGPPANISVTPLARGIIDEFFNSEPAGANPAAAASADNTPIGFNPEPPDFAPLSPAVDLDHWRELKGYGINIGLNLPMDEFLLDRTNKPGSLCEIATVIRASSEAVRDKIESLLRRVCLETDDPFITNKAMYAVQSIRLSDGRGEDKQLVLELIKKEEQFLYGGVSASNF